MEKIIHEILSNTILLWCIVIIFFLTFSIIMLVFLLLRREKVLQLMKFQLSPIGIKLTIELNTDKKIELLALENIALREEIKALKAEKVKDQWTHIGRIIALMIIMGLIKFKFKLGKFPVAEEIKDAEVIPDEKKKLDSSESQNNSTV